MRLFNALVFVQVKGTHSFAMESEIDSRKQVAQDAVNTAAAVAVDTTLPELTNDGKSSASNDEGSVWVQKKRRTQVDLFLSTETGH